MKKKCILLMMIVLSILLIGCKSQKDHLDDSVIITNAGGGYSPAMSSVPGLPLDLKVTSEKPSKLEIRVEVEKGNLLSWIDGKVNILGKDIILDFNNTTIYWSPLTGDYMDTDSESNLNVSIIESESKETLETVTYKIENNNGVYRLID